MSTDNNNLEEMVEKALESAGILPKIRAELRANVFHVLEKGSSFQNNTYMDKIKEFVSNKNGLLLMSLVKDLFDHLELTFTTSVFEPETGAGHHYQCIDRNDIFEELPLSKDDERPLLLQILEKYQSNSKSTVAVKSCSTISNIKTYEGSPLALILKNNTESMKTILDSKSKSPSPIKTNVFEQSVQFDNFTNSGSLSSNPNSDKIQLKELESLESSNSSSIEKLSPIKKPPPIDQNDNTDEDVKSDLKSNKNDNESSLEDIETDENVSCGDSLPSTDLSTQNGSPEMIKTHNIHL